MRWEWCDRVNRSVDFGRRRAGTAFEDVVTGDARRLYSLALSVLDDAGEAEDAVQETLVKAWLSAGAAKNAQNCATTWVCSSGKRPFSVGANSAQVTEVAIFDSRIYPRGWDLRSLG